MRNAPTALALTRRLPPQASVYMTLSRSFDARKRTDVIWRKDNVGGELSSSSKCLSAERIANDEGIAGFLSTVWGTTLGIAKLPDPYNVSEYLVVILCSDAADAFARCEPVSLHPAATGGGACPRGLARRRRDAASPHRVPMGVGKARRKRSGCMSWG